MTRFENTDKSALMKTLFYRGWTNTKDGSARQWQPGGKVMHFSRRKSLRNAAIAAGLIQR